MPKRKQTIPNKINEISTLCLTSFILIPQLPQGLSPSRNFQNHLCIVCLPRFCLRTLAFSLSSIRPFVTVFYLLLMGGCGVLLCVTLSFLLIQFSLFYVALLLCLCFVCGYTFFHSIPPERVFDFIAFGPIDTLSCVLFRFSFPPRGSVCFLHLPTIACQFHCVQHFVILSNSIFVLIENYSCVVSAVGPKRHGCVF